MRENQRLLKVQPAEIAAADKIVPKEYCCQRESQAHRGHFQQCLREIIDPDIEEHRSQRGYYDEPEEMRIQRCRSTVGVVVTYRQPDQHAVKG
ncbi:hypothetical protein DSECCO2_578570 [anaerobic digester metagenome]